MIILKHRVEGGRRPLASGTPAIWGAHNSEALVQQPSHQSLVRESIPSQVIEAPSVGAFRALPSRRISDQFLANVTKVKKCARRGVIRIGPVSVAPVGRIHLPRFFQLAGCGTRGPACVARAISCAVYHEPQ